MPQRKFKPRNRVSEVRDARLIIIAAEGTHTEKRYFEDLATDERYRNHRVHVAVLERDSTASAPEHVIEAQNAFCSEYSLTNDDELWLVIDVDRWGDEKLSQIATECHQKKYLLAVSNPCFEVWLLHITALDKYTPQELEDMLSNKKSSGKTHLELELIKLLKQYNKSNLNTADFLPHITNAIERAKALDLNPKRRWPDTLGTRLYLLAESIIRKKE